MLSSLWFVLQVAAVHHRSAQQEARRGAGEPPFIFITSALRLRHSLARSLQTPAGFTQNVHDHSVTQSITGTDKFLLHLLSYVPHVTQRQPERHRCCLPESLVQAAKKSTISNDSYPVKHFAMSLIMWDVSV